MEYSHIEKNLENYRKNLEIIKESCIVYSGTCKYISGESNPAIDCRHPAAQPFVEELRKNFGPFSGLKECESGIHTIVEHSKRMRNSFNEIEKELKNSNILTKDELDALKERLICTEGCKHFTELLDKKSELIDKLFKKFQNHLDKEL